MATGKNQFELLVTSQLETYEKIKQVFDTYKKYGSRKHVKYVEEKISSIQVLWAQFLADNGKIMAVAMENQEHDYFKKGFCSKAKKVTEQYMEVMQEELIKLKELEADTEGDEKFVEEDGSGKIDQVPDNVNKAGSGFDISLISSEQEKRYKKQYLRASEIKKLHDSVVKASRILTETNYRSKIKYLSDYWQRF